jgi:ribosomal protein S18 acetylase RimI-like enzyme
MTSVELRAVDPEHPDARRCIEAYFAELGERSNAAFDRTTSISIDPDELRPPAGVLLIAYRDGVAVGCGALRHRGAGVPSEIKRMWVSRDARGLGLGRRLLTALEQRAAADGAVAVRLDTNKGLSEAIALYRSAGYVDIPRFNDEPFAHHWFEKRLVD